MQSVEEYLDSKSDKELVTMCLELKEKTIPEDALIRKVVKEINEKIHEGEIFNYPERVYIMSMYNHIAGVLACRYIKSLVKEG